MKDKKTFWFVCIGILCFLADCLIRPSVYSPDSDGRGYTLGAQFYIFLTMPPVSATIILGALCLLVGRIRRSYKKALFVFSILFCAVGLFEVCKTVAITYVLQPKIDYGLAQLADKGLFDSETEEQLHGYLGRKSSNKETDRTRLIKGKSGKYGLRYDSSVWKLTDMVQFEGCEYVFVHKDETAYASVIYAPPSSITLDELKKNYLEGLKLDGGTNIYVDKAEVKEIDGERVLSMVYGGDYESASHKFYGYLYAGQLGRIIISVSTTKVLFDDYKSAFESFLSGLELYPAN